MMRSIDDQFMEKLNAVLEEHLSEKDFDVDDLCTEIGISRSQLHRRLSDIKGQSTTRYIRTFKLQKAKELLAHNTGRVSEIAEQLGFSSPSYFSQVFTEEFGHPPREEPAANKEEPPADRLASGKFKKPILLVTFGLMVIILVSIFYPRPVATTKAIAVLPFVNMSGDPSDEYFSDGITEDIIHQLTKVPGVHITSRTSSFLFKNSNQPITEIARNLKANIILEGSVRRDSNRVVVTAQLIDADRDVHLWSEKFDREINEVFDLQSDIARAVGVKISRSMDLNSNPQDIPTTSFEAYDLTLKARSLMYTYTPDNAKKAIEILHRVLAIDPSYSEAYSRIAGSYLVLGTWIGDLHPRHAEDSLDKYLNQAFLFDPNLALNHCNEAYNQFLFKRNYQKAEEHFLKAEQLDPGEIINISGMQHLLNCLGRFSESLEWVKKGEKSDPLSLWNYAYKGTSLLLLGREDEALEFQLQALETIPYHPVMYDKVGFIKLNMGDFPGAIEILEKGIDRFGVRQPSILSYLAIAYYKIGNRETSDRIIEELTNKNEAGEKETAFYLGVFYAAIGENETALSWLRKAIDSGDVEVIWMNVEPQLDTLRKTDQFQEMLKEVEF